MLNTKCKVMSKTVIKNSKVLVRRVVGDLPLQVAICVSQVEELKNIIEDTLSNLGNLAPYHHLAPYHVSPVLSSIERLCDSYSKCERLCFKLTEIHKSLNPEDLGLEVID